MSISIGRDILPVEAAIAVGKKLLKMRMMMAAAASDSPTATGHHQGFGQKTDDRTSNQD